MTAPVLPEITDATRREFLAGLAAAGLLVGCGSADTDDAATPSAGFPRTVEHESGSTRIETAPKRIAAVTDGGELAALLALGITPVGFGARNDPLTPWTATAGADDPAIPRYSLSGETNFETMAAWRPDLIVGQLGRVTTDTIGNYNAVAPTIATQSVNWRVSLRQVAAATGREAAAQRVSDAIVAQTMELAAELDGLGGLRIGWVLPFPEVWAERLANSSVGLLFPELSLEPLPSPPAQIAGAGVVDEREVALERIGDLDYDALLILDNTDDGSARALAETNPLWETLPAVRAGRVAFLDPDVSEATSGSALSLPFLLDALGRILPPLATGTGG